jgi:signal transduction histidine kinase/DNA-binding response OmpR family regulator
VASSSGLWLQHGIRSMDDIVILIADDSADIRNFLSEDILGPEGYVVHTTSDGQAALQKMRELQPDLLITDHGMPGLTGIELIRQLQDEMPLVPIILITGEGSENLAADALRAGAANYLIKPFDADSLLEAVKLALEEGRRRIEWLQARARAEANAQALQRRVQELEALAKIGRSVGAGLDLDEMLTMIVDAAVRLTDAEEGCLLLLDEESGELYMRASKNFDQEFTQSFRLRSNDSLAGQVVETGKVVILDETSPRKIMTAYLVHALIYVPLMVRGNPVGVLGVDNRQEGHALTHEHVKVMRALADYAAIAIDNARLYEQSESQRRKLEAIIAQTRNGVLVLDENQCVLLINQAACDILGVDADVIGRPATEISDDAAVLELLKTEGDTPHWEEVELRDSKIYNAQRADIEGIGQVIVLHDISRLKEIDRIKSEFVTTVTHDLRSPLTAILGYVELVARAGDLNEQQQEFIRRVHLSVDQITSLITDLLDLGRIEAGLDESKEPTQVPVLARYALEGMRAFAETRAVTLEEDLCDDLPLVIGDPLRLRQMVGNLIENAIKYTPAGGKVHVDCREEDDQVILRVRDTGIGISPGDQSRLFSRFFRGSNVPDQEAGTGLGLSIVKSIVDNHNGRIWIESRLGVGTAVTVVLPAAPA